MPPLRERKDDIPLIAEHYARQYARELGKRISGVSPSAMEALLAYPWPGNIRHVPPSTLESRIRRLGIDKYASRRRVPAQWRTGAPLA